MFLAEPTDESALPKTLPDYESAGACWCDVADVTSGLINLRGSEPLKWFPHVAEGGLVLPLAIPEEHAAAMRDVPF